MKQVENPFIQSQSQTLKPKLTIQKIGIIATDALLLRSKTEGLSISTLIAEWNSNPNFYLKQCLQAEQKQKMKQIERQEKNSAALNLVNKKKDLQPAYESKRSKRNKNISQ